MKIYQNFFKKGVAICDPFCYYNHVPNKRYGLKGNEIMAYVSKDRKVTIKNDIDGSLKEHGFGNKVKYSMKIEHYSTLVLNIKSCHVDLKENLLNRLNERKNELLESGCYGVREMEMIENYISKNEKIDVDSEWNRDLNFHYHSKGSKEDLGKFFTGEALDVLWAIHEAVHKDWYDESDAMTDYFNVDFYFTLKIGDNKGGFSVIKK
ncbi:MAG: hypothetical protein RSC93_01915 [Erysipelotrichaceae bacterium]